MEKVWRDERRCCACLFPWACGLPVLLILLLLHFLLHLPAPCSLTGRRSFLSGRLRLERDPADGRGLGFSELSQRPAERQRWRRPRANSSRHHSIPTSAAPAHGDAGRPRRCSLAASKWKEREKEGGKPSAVLCSMAWKQAIRANAQRHTNTAAGASTDITTANISPRCLALIGRRSALLSGRWKQQQEKI